MAKPVPKPFDRSESVSITKAQLAALAPNYGKLEEKRGEVYVGFVGRINLSTREYDGEHRFRAPTPKEKESLERFSLSSVLGGRKKASVASVTEEPKPKTSKPPDDKRSA